MHNAVFKKVVKKGFVTNYVLSHNVSLAYHYEGSKVMDKCNTYADMVGLGQLLIKGI